MEIRNLISHQQYNTLCPQDSTEKSQTVQEMALSAAQLSELMQGPMISVFVGPRRVHFSVPKAMICHYSGFIAIALSNGFRESTEQQIELPADDPALFGAFVRWLFNRETGIGKEQKTRIEIWDDYCALYYFADKSIIPELQYHICRQIEFELLYPKDRYVVLAPELVIEVYENTPPVSPLREMISKHINAGFCKERIFDLSKRYKDCFNTIPNFALDVVGRLQVELELVDERLYPRVQAPVLGPEENEDILALLD